MLVLPLVSISSVTRYLFQEVPLSLTVFPLQFAKLAVIANPLIYVIMNKAVSQILRLVCNFLTSANFQFQKAFITSLPRDVGQYFAEKVGVERGTLSETIIGRRQQPKFFGRFWNTLMTRRESEKVTSQGYFE